MKRYRFATLLSDSDVYAAAERYWEELFESIVARHGEGEEWRHWLTKTFVDGTQIAEGTVLSKVSPAKGIIVVQNDPDTWSNQNDVVAWTGVFGDAEFDSQVNYLRISLVLTDESAKVAGRLIDTFIVKDFAEEDAEQMIQELITETRSQ